MRWLEQEKQKLSGLSRKAKLTYIWDYYKLFLIGAAALVLLAWYIISSMMHAAQDTYVYITYVNTFANIGEDSDFWQGYTDYCAVDESQYNIIFDAENYFDMTQDHVTGNYYYEKAVVLFDSQTMDAIVMERENLAALGQSGRLIDLQDSRTKHLAERYADRLITISHTDESGVVREIPVGIDISDSILVTKEKAYTDCALGISADAQHIEAVEKFLNYILQEG